MVAVMIAGDDYVRTLELCKHGEEFLVLSRCIGAVAVIQDIAEKDGDIGLDEAVQSADCAGEEDISDCGSPDPASVERNTGEMGVSDCGDFERHNEAPLKMPGIFIHSWR